MRIILWHLQSDRTNVTRGSKMMLSSDLTGPTEPLFSSPGGGEAARERHADATRLDAHLSVGQLDQPPFCHGSVD